MAEVKWLVEDFEGDGTLDPLIHEIKRLGMPIEVINPFDNILKDKYTNYGPDDCVIYYGSLNLGWKIQREQRWIPGVYCNFQNLSCLTYYSHWGEFLFNQDYLMLPLLEVDRRKDEIFDKFGVDGAIFMRPDSGAKTFYGNVYPYDEWDSELKLMDGYAGKPLDEILVVVSSPKPISREWRIVVGTDNGPIAASQYKKDGELNEDTGCPVDVWNIAVKLSKHKWQPDRLYTVDVCESEGKFYFLEVNSFSCSGLYRCAPYPIVKMATQAAIKEWQEYQDV